MTANAANQTGAVRENGPADAETKTVEYGYQKAGKTPAILVILWAIFFTYMVLYVGQNLVPALLDQLGKK